MLVAVVPARNEARTIGRVVDGLLALGVDLVIPVVNGSTDATAEEVAARAGPRVAPVFFTAPLGVDVPRAVGALCARAAGATCVLFVDGDMGGEVGPTLADLVRAVEGGADLALTDCYPHGWPAEPLAVALLRVRKLLNRAVGRPDLGAASPSHGPHAVSARFLARIPLPELAVPPAALALAARGGLKVVVGAALPHALLGSPPRGEAHTCLIAETIVGDCLEAWRVFRGQKRSRTWRGRTYIGYHRDRRWDLLSSFDPATWCACRPRTTPRTLRA
ncbi:MAG: glycosyltransferase family A protein [Bacillota bacterium]